MFYQSSCFASKHLPGLLLANMAPNLRASWHNNLRSLCAHPISEVSGALGDLGTLLPILIALTLTSSISFTNSLMFTGLFNIANGLVFGIPIPVQPMKAVSAVAISQHLGREETASAGLFVSVVILVAALSGILQWSSRVVPTPVVKGIQVGAGLALILGAGSMVKPLGWAHPWNDNRVWAMVAFLLLCITSNIRRFPYALLIFCVGIVISAIVIISSISHPIPYPQPFVSIPSLEQFRVGTLQAGIGQVPLTALNSILAVNDLALDLHPDMPEPGITSLGISVGLLNLVGAWFGCMPSCHGSGGLAGQYRFGARSGASMVALGVAKIALAVFFGDRLLELLRRFPAALLGVMVFAAGLELAKAGQSLNNGARDLNCSTGGQTGVLTKKELSEEARVERWTVMMTTVGVLLASGNYAVAFLSGMLVHYCFKIPKSWRMLEQHNDERRPLLNPRQVD
jgi:hypothetical protein